MAHTHTEKSTAIPSRAAAAPHGAEKGNGLRAVSVRVNYNPGKPVQQKSKQAVRPNPGSTAPIQRLVGFELETTSALTPGEGTPALQKDKALLTGAGWSLTVEVTGSGKVVEFKVRAIDDQSDPAVLKATVDNLATFAATLGGSAGASITIEDLATASATTVADDKFKKASVTPEGATIVAKPQMTAGISLDKIANLLEDMSKENSQLIGGPPKAEDTAGIRKKFSDTAASLDLFADIEKFSKTYQGFIALLSSYIHTATSSGRLAYFKAGVAALSRADLGLYMKIPEIAAKKAQILKDVLFYADVKEGDKLIPGGTYDDQKREVAVGITIGEWVKSIIAGTDAIPWSLQVNQESKAFELEPTGPPKAEGARAQGLPIEVRSLQSRVPHTAWSPYLVHLFKYVKVLNSDAPAPYKNLTKD